METRVFVNRKFIDVEHWSNDCRFSAYMTVSEVERLLCKLKKAVTYAHNDLIELRQEVE